ncbi:IpaD/SipD/SspD family type III secretion system needle tip protein [Yersinia mollaretii]|uniref:IpaD/SipD/SspD family type III secretion system needle tip protein n=1 Tax=Yersinia mollaretii TaxID=33060 RepID=UPI001643D847|nr:IpaD/SipD/SspD family type III secretion system needle tip protein [Yersinia mollaretii]
MTEMIVTSRPLPLIEGGYSGKTAAAQGGNDQGQAMALQGAEKLTLSASQGDPYLLAEQLLSQNHGLLPSPEADSYSRVLYPSISPSAEEIQDESRQLHRDLQKSSDHYNKANANSAARAATVAGDEGTPPHIEALESLISTIHGDYQKTYSEINQKAAEFMRDVNTAVGKISDHILAGENGGIFLQTGALFRQIDTALQKYTGQKSGGNASNVKQWAVGNAVAEPIYTFNGDNSALAFWEKKLGSGFSVVRGQGNEIKILPNLEPIKNIYKSLIENNRNNDNVWERARMSSQAFQTLQSSIDSQKNTVNSSVSQLLERFRQDNSTFETLIQLLTKMTEDLHRYNTGYIQ